MPEENDLLMNVYSAFNARDVDTVLAAMSADVDWPNGWEGGRIYGREGVRDYWTRQWAATAPQRAAQADAQTKTNNAAKASSDQAHATD